MFRVIIIQNKTGQYSKQKILQVTSCEINPTLQFNIYYLKKNYHFL